MSTGCLDCLPTQRTRQTYARHLRAECADAVTGIPPFHDRTLEQVLVGTLDVEVCSLGDSVVRRDVHVGADLGEALHGGHLAVSRTGVDGGLDPVRAALVARVGLGAAHGHGRGGVGGHGGDSGQGQGEGRKGRNVHLERGGGDQSDELIVGWLVMLSSCSFVFLLAGVDVQAIESGVVVREKRTT